jgi:hypothetical protein
MAVEDNGNTLVSFLVDAEVPQGQSTAQAPATGPELHWGGPRKSVATVTKRVDEVVQDWSDMSSTVHRLATTMDQPSTGMRLQEIELKLAFTAEGQLAFVASAGIEASLTLKFSRTA